MIASPSVTAPVALAAAGHPVLYCTILYCTAAAGHHVLGDGPLPLLPPGGQSSLHPGLRLLRSPVSKTHWWYVDDDIPVCRVLGMVALHDWNILVYILGLVVYGLLLYGLHQPQPQLLCMTDKLWFLVSAV